MPKNIESAQCLYSEAIKDFLDFRKTRVPFFAIFENFEFFDVKLKTYSLKLETKN